MGPRKGKAGMVRKPARAGPDLGGKYGNFVKKHEKFKKMGLILLWLERHTK